MNEQPENSAQDTDQNAQPAIQRPACHIDLEEYLKSEAADLWNWFSSHKARTDSSDAVRLELLKSAYRVDRIDASQTYQLADAVAQNMGLTAPITLYQAQDNNSGLNASLAWLPEEAHVVLHGPVLALLSSGETSALLAHEFAHHELYTIDNGAGLVLEQVLSAMMSDAAAGSSHERSWRSHRLQTELHCDRRAAEVTGNINDCVCALVKLETGLQDVSAEAYLAQADEVLSDTAQHSKGSAGITHPEMFIRAKALQLWQTDPDTADAVIQELVDGSLQLQQLDLLQQQSMQQLTRDFLRCFLHTRWLQTDVMFGHVKRFFADFEWTETTPDNDQLDTQLAACDGELKNYFCFVLLDFVTYDADLEEAPLAAAFVFADTYGLTDEFRTLAATELKFGKRAFQKLQTEAQKIVQQADAALEAE